MRQFCKYIYWLSKKKNKKNENKKGDKKLSMSFVKLIFENELLGMEERGQKKVCLFLDGIISLFSPFHFFFSIFCLS